MIFQKKCGKSSLDKYYFEINDDKIDLSLIILSLELILIDLSLIILSLELIFLQKAIFVIVTITIKQEDSSLLLVVT